MRTLVDDDTASEISFVVVPHELAPTRTDDRGFTLVEIVIAIVLVGILSAVVVVGVGRLTNQGSSAACSTSADAARTGSVGYFAEHLAYPTTLTQMTAASTLSLGSGVTVNSTATGSNAAGTVASGSGWTLTMTPGTGGAAPTFTCTDTGQAAAAAPTGTAACPGSFGGWVGEYYANRALTGAPALCRDDASVNFDWGNGSPAAGIPADDFSVRWTRTATFTAGSHTFTIGSDDGHRLYIDGALVLDTWRDQSYTTRSTTQTLTAGPHTIVVEFYERGGQARATATWT